MPSKATDGPLLSLLETRGGTLKLPFPAHTQCSVTHTCTQISSAAATLVSHPTPPICPAPSSSPSPSDPTISLPQSPKQVTQTTRPSHCTPSLSHALPTPHSRRRPPADALLPSAQPPRRWSAGPSGTRAPKTTLLHVSAISHKAVRAATRRTGLAHR